MALTYAQLSALVSNTTFLARVENAVAYHAEYQLNNAAATQQQKWWAEKVFVGLQCNQIAANLMRELCQDAAITGSTTGDGSDITDTALQGAVDKICEKYLAYAQ